MFEFLVRTRKESGGGCLQIGCGMDEYVCMYVFMYIYLCLCSIGSDSWSMEHFEEVGYSCTCVILCAASCTSISEEGMHCGIGLCTDMGMGMGLGWIVKRRGCI